MSGSARSGTPSVDARALQSALYVYALRQGWSGMDRGAANWSRQESKPTTKTVNGRAAGLVGIKHSPQVAQEQNSRPRAERLPSGMRWSTQSRSSMGPLARRTPAATTRILPRTSSCFFEVARSWAGHLDATKLASRPGALVRVRQSSCLSSSLPDQDVQKAEIRKSVQEPDLLLLIDVIRLIRVKSGRLVKK